MAEANWMWMAHWTVRNQLSANAGLRIAQEMGLGVRRSTWLQGIGHIRANAAIRQATFEALFVARPQAHEIQSLPSNASTNYVQYVDVYVRDLNTGKLDVRSRALQTSNLMSRDEAIEFIISRERSAIASAGFRGPTWDTMPDSVVEAGVYTATHQFVPGLIL
jgi:hypothetical protein